MSTRTEVVSIQPREFKHPHGDIKLPRQFRINREAVLEAKAREAVGGWLTKFDGEVHISRDRKTVLLLPNTVEATVEVVIIMEK